MVSLKDLLCCCIKQLQPDERSSIELNIQCNGCCQKQVTIEAREESTEKDLLRSSSFSKFLRRKRNQKSKQTLQKKDTTLSETTNDIHSSSPNSEKVSETKNNDYIDSSSVADGFNVAV